MKKYNITVNGTTYEVSVEEVGVVASAPVAAPAPVAAAPAAAAAPANAEGVKAPMPGNIMKVNVKVGDTVKKGDTLCVLEAMKMENDIKASRDGSVAAVHVSQGATVNTGDLLVSLS
ncbi:MAG: biotin/lipoyl-binding protein [Clostridia bacterium]|nr:biotin/lipoyl-binding protein [Clostridia bacterium]